MKTFKKIALFVLAIISIFSLTACGSKNVEGSLEDIMGKLYTDIAEENRPGGLSNMEINDENIESFIGTKDIEYTEAIASESMMGSIAHSVVLIRVKDAGKVEEYKDEIYEHVNPRKWICVGVEKDEVIIDSIGDLIVVIIVQDTDNRQKIADAFTNLK